MNLKFTSAPKNGYMGDIEYSAGRIPGVGKYNLIKSMTSIEKHVY